MGAPEAERGNASAAEVAVLLAIVISTPQALHQLFEPTGIFTCGRLLMWLENKYPSYQYDFDATRRMTALAASGALNRAIAIYV
jgi:hypothetical protein